MASPSFPRTLVLTASLILMAAACGAREAGPATSSPPTARPTGASSAIQFSHCMRSHGIFDFPDPGSNGALPKVTLQGLGVSSSRLQAAQTACQDLLPAGADDMFPPGEVQQLLPGMLSFSRCMRSHGVPDWPDPTVDSTGRPLFRLSAAGISRQQAHSPQIERTEARCQGLLPAALGGVPVG